VRNLRFGGVGCGVWGVGFKVWGLGGRAGGEREGEGVRGGGGAEQTSPSEVPVRSISGHAEPSTSSSCSF
jgi:hypothetical protein